MIKPVPSTLYVVCPITNPTRYKSRYILFDAFRRHMESNPTVKLTTVEVAFGERPFMIDDSPLSDTIRLRSFFELWTKENQINIGIQHVLQKYPDAQYFAWIDGDIEFIRKDWAEETIHQLQHYHVVQMWQDAFDMGPSIEFITRHQSFMRSYIQMGHKFPNTLKGSGYYGGRFTGSYSHPGYCHAATRDAIDALGGLLDVAILGSADYHMCCALIGHADKSYPAGKISPRYLYKIMQWQERAEKFIQRDVGYVPGTILHYWHGKKSQRGYTTRWDILKSNNYNPDVDLKKDSQGLWQLTDSNPRLRDALRAYFRSRNEDSIDV